MIDFFEFDKNILLISFKFNQEIPFDIINECNEKNIKTIIFNNYCNKDEMYNNSNDYVFHFRSSWRGNRFNKSIEKFNKIDLKHLVLGVNFNQNINNLPTNLESLILDNNFNKPLDNLPNKLKLLCCKNCFNFNHNLDYLPNSLEYLVIPPNFNNSLNNLPENIKYLDLYYISHIDITNTLSILPSNLETLIIEDLNNFDNTLLIFNNFKNRFNNKLQFSYKEIDYFHKVIMDNQ